MAAPHYPLRNHPQLLNRLRNHRSYVKQQLASADYDGVVQLWDVNAGCDVMQVSNAVTNLAAGGGGLR